MNVGGGGRHNRTDCLSVAAALLVLLSCGIAAASEVSDDSEGTGAADEAGLPKEKEVLVPLGRPTFAWGAVIEERR